jgi:hypothetical protein
MSTDDARQQKAEGISLDRRISFVAGAWHVHSPSGSKTYKVNPSPSAPSCEGDDFALRGRARKHILGVRKLLERQLKGEPTPAADQVPAPKPRKTYKQKWPQYNSAQEYEKGHVQELLFDLCSAVQEPQRDKPGRRPTPLRQAIFTTAFKVWSTLSCRRYQSDMRAAVRRGYLSQPYSANVVFRCLQDPDTAAVLHDLIRRSALPLKAVETVFAPDSSGFATSKFERCYGEKYSVSRRQCPWVKCHCIAG